MSARRNSTYPLLETAELTWRERIGLANDRDNVDTRGEAAHELNVHLTQTKIVTAGMHGAYMISALTNGQWEG